MAFVTWNDAYSVGVRSMDAQHRRLVDLVNQLHDAMKLGKGANVVGSVLDSLVEYTRTHFADEERLMREYAYPSYQEHKGKHDSLARQVARIREDVRGAAPALSIAVLMFLKGWLVTHIQGADRDYIPYVSLREAA